MVKKNNGRKKIDMVKINNSLNLQVSFSKRRSGVFKKASEICTLCGAEIAIIVFSPGYKVYSFGHPNVDEIVDRYLTGLNIANFDEFMETFRDANIHELNTQLNELSNQMDAAKKRGEELNRMRNESKINRWWEWPVETLNLSQLMQLRSALVELKNKVDLQVRAEKILTDQNTNAVQYLMGSSSSSQGVFPHRDENMAVNMNGGYTAPNVMPRPPGFGGGF